MINIKETHIFSILNNIQIFYLTTWQIIMKWKEAQTQGTLDFPRSGSPTHCAILPTFITSPLAMCDDGRSFQALNYFNALHK